MVRLFFNLWQLIRYNEPLSSNIKIVKIGPNFCLKKTFTLDPNYTKLPILQTQFAIYFTKITFDTKASNVV